MYRLLIMRVLPVLPNRSPLRWAWSQGRTTAMRTT